MKVIKYGSKDIVISKDRLNITFGVLMIVLSAVLLGLVKWLLVGANIAALLNGAFWLDYITTISILYITYYGMYTIRRTTNLRTPKIIIQREKIKEHREEVERTKQIDDIERWLQLYNYKRKINAHRANLCKNLSRTRLPAEPKEGEKFFKLKVIIYDNVKSKKEFYANQISYCDMRLEALSLYYDYKDEEAAEIENQIKDDDIFYQSTRKIRDITYQDLFTISSEYTSKYTDDVRCNVPKMTASVIIPALLMGCLLNAIMRCMELGYVTLDLNTVVDMIFTSIMIFWYAMNGLKFADMLVFDGIYVAEGNILKIIDLFFEYKRVTHINN